MDRKSFSKGAHVKGILLAGGAGTRLAPLTQAISKQLLPVYDKPAIYYPLSVLMLAGIREVLIISTPHDTPLIQKLLGDGSQIGVKIDYAIQEAPRGIAEALIIGEKFIAGDSVCLILGDNIFYGHDLVKYLNEAREQKSGARVFAYNVNDPERYGVIQFDSEMKALAIDEKPKNPKSNWAVTGIYFYDKSVSAMARGLKPSARGELEITDLNRLYLEKGELRVTLLKRGFAWLDTGTFDSLLSSSQFVQTLEKRQGLKIACLEEIAYKMKFISIDQFRAAAEKYQKSDYGQYLLRAMKELN